MNLSLLFNKYRTQILIWGSFIALFLATRLYKIMSLPIFTDEAIYTRWAQIARFDPNWRFISLTDGKQPLFVWFDMVFMRFTSDPLLAGRLVSVFAGVFTMIGLYFLGKVLFNKKVGLLASLIYILYPFALVYDRMALYDSLVATLSVWSLLFTILLVKHKRLDVALILGMILGAGVLNKTSGFLSIYLLPLSLLLFNFKEKVWRKSLLKWIGLAFVAVLLSYGFYSVLRLSPFLHIVDEKNRIFVYSFSEWLSHPTEFLEGNLRGVLDWAYKYLTAPVIILIAWSFFINKKDLFKKLFLALWFAAPFIALALFGKTLYPRFILFMTMPLLILAAYSLVEVFSRVRSNYIKAVVFFALMFLMLRADFLILTDFKNSPIPFSDKEQYINGWPAGGGVKEAVEFFKDASKEGKIFVGTQGTFGLMPYALEIYFWDDKNAEIKGYWPVPDLPPSDAVEKSRHMPVYFLFYQPCPLCEFPGAAPKSWRLEEEFRIKKGDGNFLIVYRLLP